MRFGIIGTGKIHTAFAQAAHSLGHTLSRVYSRTAQNGEEFARRCGVAHWDTDLSDFLRASDVEAVYVASPHFCHFEHVTAALAAGKHVLCEKTMALSYGDYLEMRACAMEQDRVLLEAVRGDFDPVFGTFVEAIARVGQVRRADFHFCQYSSRYDARRRGQMPRAMRADLGNSALADIGVYPLHAMLYAFGVPAAIQAYPVFLSDGFECAGHVMLDYSSDGFVGEVSYSKVSECPLPSFVEGEDGFLTLDHINAPGKVVFTPRGGEPQVLASAQVQNNMIYEIAAFCRMTEGKISAQVYLDVSAQTIRLMDEIYSRDGFCYTDRGARIGRE